MWNKWLWVLVFLAPVWALEAQNLTYQGNRYTVVRVNLKTDKLVLFGYTGQHQPLYTFERAAKWLEAKGQTLLFATNAGMFRPDYGPVGLYVSEGQQSSSLRLCKTTSVGNFCLKPNGVFALTENGAAIVVSEYYPRLKGVKLATQSGPMLVIEGRIHGAFRPGSTSVHIRNGVGLRSPTEVVFAISEGAVNFHQFAELFRDALGCNNALYFDGSVSSLYLRGQRDDQIAFLGPMIGVVEGKVKK
jgi:uncharacterized protein YigE (DUF2233 family)